MEGGLAVLARCDWREGLASKAEQVERCCREGLAAVAVNVRECVRYIHSSPLLD